MFLQFLPIGVHVLESSCPDYEFHFLQLFQQVFSVRVGSNCTDWSFFIVQDIQLTSLNENSYYAGDVLFGHCQVKRGPSVHIFGPCVRPEFLEEDLCQIGMALPSCPM